MRILEKGNDRYFTDADCHISFKFFLWILPELRHNFKELSPRISLCDTGTLFLPPNSYVNYANRCSVSLEYLPHRSKGNILSKPYANRCSVSLEYFPHRSMGNILSKPNLWVGRSSLDQVIGG